jgi:hypothetical protein
VAGCCEHGNEHSGSVLEGNFFFMEVRYTRNFTDPKIHFWCVCVSVRPSVCLRLRNESRHLEIVTEDAARS